MAFKDWFWDCYLDYSKPVGRQRAKSQAQFARYLGETPANVSRWLNGDATPERNTVIRLAPILGDEIYSITGYEPPSISEWIADKSVADLLAISALIDAWKMSISEKGIEMGSPESEEIIRELARKSQ